VSVSAAAGLSRPLSARNPPTEAAGGSSIERVTDGELVGLARAGDTAAFGELVNRHQRAVYRATLAALGSPADAEDVAQEAFVLAFRKLGGFRGESSVRTWMVAIGWRLALSRRLGPLRRLRQMLSIEPAVEAIVPSRAPSPEAQVVDADLLAHVRGLIQRLSPKLRDALLLSTGSEMSSEEVAAILEIPPGTLRWRVLEARRQLREHLRRQGIRWAR
jgi:RNA polymerase sigma-70 factor (ECF subfamily)